MLNIIKKYLVIAVVLNFAVFTSVYAAEMFREFRKDQEGPKRSDNYVPPKECAKKDKCHGNVYHGKIPDKAFTYGGREGSPLLRDRR